LKLHYPIVRIPAIIEEIINSEIPVDYKIEEPISPQRRKINFNVLIPWLFGLFIILLFTDSGFVFNVIFFIGISSLVIVLFAIFGFNNIQIEYNESLKKYEYAKFKYDIQKQQFEELLREIRNPIDTAIYRKNRIKEIIFSSNKPDLSFLSKKGKTEKFFFSELNKRFLGKIFVDCAIQPYRNSLPYQPDFTFQDLETNLHIDIEIDEPYVLNTFEPIHFMENGEHSDEKRDSVFNEYNWIVIRFTEFQVVSYPKECCDFIQKIIDSVSNNDEIFEVKNYFKYKTSAWTKNNSYEMMSTAYRETYLKKINTNIDINPQNGIVVLKERHFEDEDDLPF